MSVYSQYQPDWVFADECPCANHIEGADPSCAQHGWEIVLLASGETALSDDDQHDADMALLWQIIADELGVKA